MIDGFIQGIEDFFTDLVDTLIGYGKDALDELGIREMFNDLLNTEPIQVLLDYVPLVNELLHLQIVAHVFATEFAILLTLVLFKIVVKVIPTIW